MNEIIDADDTYGGCAKHEPVALMVLGDDMAPEFPDRCVIVLDPYSDCGDEAFVVAEVDGERWFRQYREDRAAGRRWLSALKPGVPDIEMGPGDRILGVVVQRNIRRKIKHYVHFPKLARTAD